MNKDILYLIKRVKPVLKKIRYKKLTMDLINLYLVTIGVVGVGYAYQVINNIDFPAELKSYEGFLSFSNHMYYCMLSIKFSLFIFELLVLNKNIYLKTEVRQVKTVLSADGKAVLNKSKE